MSMFANSVVNELNKIVKQGIWMCGIAGILETRDLADALKSLHHRGPDGQQFWQDDGVTLGHTRLSIHDLSANGVQPMHSVSGRYVITFNGEIYNFKALRQSLDSSGHTQWRGHSDTEVLLALIDKHGFAIALTYLEGMFAIAVWDREEKSLYLARDRMGEKPLYYGRVGRQFVFASELKAIRAMLKTDLRLNHTAARLFTRLSYIPSPHTIYDGISKCPPGCWLKVRYPVDEIELTPQPFWTLKPNSSPTPFTGSFDEAKDVLQQHLSRILSNQLLADVPVGAFLSGGLDSSLIVSLAQHLNSTPLRTFTIAFDDPAYNEAEHAKAIAKHLGTVHHELVVNPQDALSVIPDLARIYDEPFADSSQIPSYFVAKMTRQHVTVALSGDGGDELFSGYNRYVWGTKLWNVMRRIPVSIRRRWSHSSNPRSFNWLKRHGGSLPLLKHFSILSNKLDKVSRALRCESQQALYLSLIQTMNHDAIFKQSSSSIEEMLSLQPVENFENFSAYMAYHDCIGYLPGDILTKVDRATMSHSLESRTPFLDHHLVAFAMSLPTEYKMQGKIGKRLPRSLLADYVPESLWDRPKTGFSIPLGCWLRENLRDWSESLLSPESLRQHDLYDEHTVQQLWKEHINGSHDHAYGLWNILMFQAWYQEWM